MKSNKLLFLVGLICALSIARVFANDIILEIDPTCFVTTIFTDALGKKTTVNLIDAQLVNARKDQVVFRHGVDQSRKWTKNRYPLDSHGNFKYIGKNDRLVIKKYDKKNKKLITLKMPDKIAQRMLSFLLKETEEPELDCRAFCIDVCEGDALFEKIFDKTELWKILRRVKDEKILKPGDVIAYFAKNRETTVDLVHWSLVVEPGLYISKMGRGSSFYVHDLKSMQKVYRYVFVCQLGNFDK